MEEVAAVARHDEIALATKPTACPVYMLSGAASDAVHWPLARCHEVVGLKPTTGVISSVAVMLNAPHFRCCWTHCSLRIRRFGCARHTSDGQQFGSRINNDKSASE